MTFLIQGTGRGSENQEAAGVAGAGGEVAGGDGTGGAAKRGAGKEGPAVLGLVHREQLLGMLVLG